MERVFDEIADNLAEYSYAVVDQFLSQNEARDIVEAVRSTRPDFQKAGVGKDTGHRVNEAIRGDYIQWLDRDTAPVPTQLYLHRLDQLREFLNYSLFLSLKDFEVHLTVYPEGAYYKRHLDQFKGDDHRKVSVICYLNEGWNEAFGGQLRMYLPANTIDILPVAGRLVCFRSDKIEHEVLPATRERMSLTGWMLDQVADLRHL